MALLSADRRDGCDWRAWRDRFKASRRHGARRAAVRLRRAARRAAVGVVLRFVIVFLELIREQLREAGADLRRVGADLDKSRGQDAELYRNDDFLFAVDAESDDEIGAYLSV